MKFLLTYRNGAQEAIITDAETCDAQAMRTFGMTLEEAREHGANVELADEVKNAFTEDEFLKGDPSGELVDERPAGEPSEEFVAEHAEQPAGETAEPDTTAETAIEGHAPEVAQAPAPAATTRKKR